MLSLERLSQKGANKVLRPVADLLSWLIPTAAIVATERNTMYPELQECWDKGGWRSSARPAAVLADAAGTYGAFIVHVAIMLSCLTRRALHAATTTHSRHTPCCPMPLPPTKYHLNHASSCPPLACTPCPIPTPQRL
jgi:hypothetical protein